MAALPFARPTPAVLSLPVREEAWIHRVLGRGGRVFQSGEESWIVLPGAGRRHVLVPRGVGKPLLTHPAPGGFRCASSGAPCAPARWQDAGALAGRAWHVRLGTGPVAAEYPGHGNSAEGFLALVPSGLRLRGALAEAPHLRDGLVVAESRGRVVARSRRARRQGVELGERVERARARVPGLSVQPALANEASLEDVIARLRVHVPDLQRAPGAPLVLVAQGGDPARAQRLVAWAWQALGLELRVAVGAAEQDARALARLLGPGMVGIVEPGVRAVAWKGRFPGRMKVSGRRREWKGAALPDLEGVASVARLLCGGGPLGAVILRVEGVRGARTAVLAGVPEEPSLRRAVLGARAQALAFGLGGVHALSLTRCPRRRAIASPSQRSPLQDTAPGRPSGPAQLSLFLPARAW